MQKNLHFVRDFLQFSHFVASKSTFSYEFSLEPENLQPQNQYFVRGFRQFSAHRTKCHDRHGICTLSPLDAALPMRFAKNTQHGTSKVLRLPRKMTMDTSKVLRLPRKLLHIFWKRRKSIAPATQNDFRHVPEHVWMSRSATPATRNEATRRLKPPKRTTPAKLPIGTAIRGSRERLRTVADGCDHKRNVERTHPQPPDPQSETRTLATHSGKRREKRYRRWDSYRLYFCFFCLGAFSWFFKPTWNPTWNLNGHALDLVGKKFSAQPTVPGRPSSSRSHQPFSCRRQRKLSIDFHIICRVHPGAMFNWDCDVPPSFKAWCRERRERNTKWKEVKNKSPWQFPL